MKKIEKKNKLTLQKYMDFVQLFKQYQGSSKNNRLFGIKNKKLMSSPVSILMKWKDENIEKINKNKNSKKEKNIFQIDIILYLIVFIFGLFIGYDIISYNGKHPVNIIYFLVIIVFIPLLSISLSIISVFLKNNLVKYIIYIFPIFWIKKAINLIKKKFNLNNSIKFNIPSNITKIIFIKKVQLFSLIFTSGIFISFIISIITQDIAFGWSTTLKITPIEFYNFLDFIAKPWSFLFGNLLPSIEIVELSRYYRLGKEINITMLNEVANIGIWWKFLSLSIIFYSIILRALTFIFIEFVYRRKIKKSFLGTYGAKKLLYEFSTPVISRKIITSEDKLKNLKSKDNKNIFLFKKYSLYEKYDITMGWNFHKDEVLLINEKKEILTDLSFYIGNNNSLKEDKKIAQKAKGEILIYVKSWEPPIMDFVDFLEIIIKDTKTLSVQIYPISEIEEEKLGKEEDIKIWIDKLENIKSKKIWVLTA